MASIRRSLAISLFQKYLMIGMALVSNIILARLLTPYEIGSYSVSLAVIGMAQVIRDFGIGNFIIQEKKLTEAHIRTAFGFTLFMGSSLFVIFFFGSSYIADFYANNQITQTITISALNFLVLPFCTISMSLLTREMAFNKILWVNLISSIIGFSTTISLAYQQFGANSMAIGSVVTNLSIGFGAWVVRTDDNKILLPSFSEWRSILKFGGQSTISAVVTSIAIDANDLIIGKILGMSSVAIFGRAQGLMNLFHRDIMSSIRSVALPAFSKAHREDEAIENKYIYSVAAITLVAWPFYGFVSLYPLEILRLMYGPQWDSARELVPVFCLIGAVASMSSLITCLMIAVGRIDLCTRIELFLQPLRILVIAFAAIVYKTIFACTIAFLLITIIALPLFYVFKARCVPSNLVLLISNFAKSAIVSFATLAVPFGYSLNENFNRTIPLPIESFLLIAFSTLPIWIATMIIFKHPIAQDPLFKRILQNIFHVFNYPIELWNKK